LLVPWNDPDVKFSLAATLVLHGKKLMGNFRPKAVFEQAQIEETTGNLRVAASHYASVGLYLKRKGKNREARRLMTKAIALHPNSARLYLHLAHLEALLANRSQAATAMRAFCSTAALRGRLGEYEAQVQELIPKFPDLGVIYFSKWLQTDRTEPRVHLAAAKCFEGTEDAARALQALRQAFALAPGDKTVAEAIRSFLERQCDTVRMHAWQGYESGRLSREQILSVLSDSASPVELANDAPVASNLNGSFSTDQSLSAMIASLEEQLAEVNADKKLKEISDMKPLVQEFRRNAEGVLRGNDSARWDMGHAFAEMGLVDEALEELKKVPPQSEWYIRSLFKQAEILVGQNSLLGALDCLQTILRTENPASSAYPEALYQAAHVYFQLGDWEQSLKNLDWLDKSRPDYRESRALRSRLEEARKKLRTGT
jgi:tetratricopeptide (TPR) repeat protein